MSMCLARGGVGGEVVRGLGLGFTNHVATGGVLDVCLCFGRSRYLFIVLGGYLRI